MVSGGWASGIGWRTAFLLFLMVSPASAQVGLSGLMNMRTPDVIGGYAAEIGLDPRFEKLLKGGIPNRYRLTVGYTQGLGARMEAGIQVPVVASPLGAGLHPVSLLGKVRLVEGDAWGLATTAILSIPTSRRGQSLGSGLLGGGGELNVAYSGGRPVWSAALSYQRIDYCPGCRFPGAQLETARPVPVLGASLGIDVPYGDVTSVMVELHGAWADTGGEGARQGDTDARLNVGGRFPLTESLAATPSVGFGLPHWYRANVGLVAGVMFHYRIHSSALPERGDAPHLRRTHPPTGGDWSRGLSGLE